MTTPALMVLGCTSDAGKSLIATALCRSFANRGIAVAPYKAQNMSNNARVVEGGEIGVAQWLQAQAARVQPTVDMNPVLVKPEADTQSQVIVQGESNLSISELPWEQRSEHLWSAMTQSYDRLAAAYDLIVMEGAGSPAEINLTDLVNNRILDHADATAVLVADIDRGGAFAHLFGTWSLVPDTTKDRLKGFILNKFRGDASLLAPAPGKITELTGMQDLGVLPMLEHRLAAEEGPTLSRAVEHRQQAPSVAIVTYPYASNLDEWNLLAESTNVRWARTTSELADVDAIVLPGSKHVVSDLAWLRTTGIDQAVSAAGASGIKIIGVCGGAMMLGVDIADPYGIETEPETSTDGLGLLAHRTILADEKLVQRAEFLVENVSANWQCIEGLAVDGYEIRYGQLGGIEAQRFSSQGSILATTIHGVFENPAVIERVFGVPASTHTDKTFEVLAEQIDEHLDIDSLLEALGF